MTGRKRKEAKVFVKKNLATVEPLSIESMMIVDKRGDKFNLVRLKYRGVPTLNNIEKIKIKNPELLIDAKRDNEIREIYRLISKVNGISEIAVLNYLKDGIKNYFRYLDEFEVESIPFSVSSMRDCIIHFNNLALKGKKTSVARTVRDSLSYFLSQMGEADVARKSLPVLAAHKPSETQVALDIERELKPIAKILINGHKKFVESLNNNTTLEVHPFFDESLFSQMSNKEKWNDYEIKIKRNSFKVAMIPRQLMTNKGLFDHEKLRRVVLFNHASRCALFLFFMLTGMNTSVLINMRRSDVKFQSIGAGNFIFSSVKGRAGNKEVDNALGFTTSAKMLIESWLVA